MIDQSMIWFSVFAAVTLGVYALLMMGDPYKARVSSRIDELQGDGTNDKAKTRAQSAAKANASTGATWLTSILTPFRIGDRSRLQQRLVKAGIHHPAALSRLLSVRLLLSVIPALLAIGAGMAGYLPMDKSLMIGCFLGGIGSIIPGWWLDRATARHHLQLRKSLPDFLDVMIVCLEGGLSLQESIRRVSDELRIVHPALAFELGMVRRDVELGATVDQALKRFAARTDYEAIRSLSTFIRESQRFGTNITEALRNQSEMLRTQREQAAEENAQKASVKLLLPTLLLIFPAIFVVLVGPAIIQIQEAFSTK